MRAGNIRALKDQTMTDIRELLTAASIAAYRNEVIEECAVIAEQTWIMQEGPATEVAAAIRRLKDKS